VDSPATNLKVLREGKRSGNSLFFPVGVFHQIYDIRYIVLCSVPFKEHESFYVTVAIVIDMGKYNSYTVRFKMMVINCMERNENSVSFHRTYLEA
jgi:hypothetical protein